MIFAYDCKQKTKLSQALDCTGMSRRPGFAAGHRLCAVQKMETPAVTFSTPYQAVVLINNSVYYGKLAG